MYKFTVWMHLFRETSEMSHLDVAATIKLIAHFDNRLISLSFLKRELSQNPLIPSS